MAPLRRPPRPPLAPLALPALLLAAAAAAASSEEASEGVCAAGSDCSSGAAGLPDLQPAAGPEDFPRYAATPRAPGARLWTAAELALHRGADKKLPLLLCVLGEIFDVGTGARFYSPDKGYSVFVGADRSRAFADTSLKLPEAEMSRVLDLEPDFFEAVTGWRDFYRKHETYRFVGYLHGRYFDAQGQPTAEWHQVEALHTKQASVEDFKQSLKSRWKACNSRHEQAKPHVELWCDDGYHLKGAVPVHMYAGPVDAQGKQEGWCACVPPAQRPAAEAEAARSGVPFRLADYRECRPAAGQAQGQRCLRPKGSAPP